MNVRLFGSPPFSVVVVHGGPGAPGEMKQVAEELSKSFGVIEPFQTKDSIDGQIEELKTQIEKAANVPVILVGYSWGAWLVYLLAAKYPHLVKKIVLVSSGPFEESYAKQIMPTRMSRLTIEEQKEVENIMELLQNGQGNNNLVNKFGSIMSMADSFDKEGTIEKENTFEPYTYRKVWTEAEELRHSGKLLLKGKDIQCPVVAIHGDYDPHPAEGVKKPLSKLLKNFHFILLKHCGHTPWEEKQTKQEFYKVLKEELM